VVHRRIDFAIVSRQRAVNEIKPWILLDADGDTLSGSPTFRFQDPTFTFRSLRGNAVLRWEYRPGSTLFVVWTRSSQIPELARGNIQFSDDASALFQGPSENVFLVKMTYWLGF